MFIWAAGKCDDSATTITSLAASDMACPVI
jgi:hypothetical protein